MTNPPNNNAVATPDDRWHRLARLVRAGPAVWTLLIGYVCLLAVLAAVYREGQAPAAAPTWQVSRISWLTALAVRLAVGAAVEVLAAFILGFAWILVCRRHPPWLLHPRITAAAAALSTVAVLTAIWRGGVPALLDLLVPGVGSVLGVAIGSAVLAGPTVRHMLVELVLILVSGLGLLAITAWAATSRRPAPFPATRVPSVEKHRLMVLIKNRSQRRAGSLARRGAVGVRRIGAEKSRPGGRQDAQTLELTDHDVNLLAAWWLRADRNDRKVRVRFVDGRTFRIEATLVLGRPFGFPRYLNLRATGRLEVQAGRPRLDLAACSVGSLRAPRVTLGGLARAVLSVARQDPQLNAIMACVESLDIGPGTVRVVGNADQFRQRILPTLVAKASITSEVTAATRAHIRHLVLVAHTMPRRGDDRFVWIVQTAFAFARERSHWNRPVDENTAALLAVAILAGDLRIAALVGPVIDREMRGEAQRRMRNFRIDGRADWEKHLVISAALTILLNEAMDEMIGLMKEQLDSAGGGSGFSFSDLMADRAGSRLASRAVRDEVSARRLQDALADGFLIRDLFPPAHDLPEGIGEAELKHRYGGVGGAGYHRMEVKIEKKLDRCQLLDRARTPG